MAYDFGAPRASPAATLLFQGCERRRSVRLVRPASRKLGGSARDIILYNIPSVTQVALSVDLIGRIKEGFPGVVTGVKDSSGDWAYTQRLLAAHKDLAILIGDERYLAEGVALGGQGAISGLPMSVPREPVVSGRGTRVPTAASTHLSTRCCAIR